MKNVIVIFKAILAILIWIMIVGNASAIQDPFLVYGYVKYDNGSMVDGATVNISVSDQALTETTNSMGKYTGVLEIYQDGDEIIVTTVKGLYTGSAADILDKSSGGLMINVTITVTGNPPSPSPISITPSSSQLTPGAQFTLTIPITPATPITGAQFDLLFNSSLATVTSVTEGNLLNQDGASTFFNCGTINNAAGTVTDVYGAILGNTTVSSLGSMANISMTAGYNTGNLDINLTNVIISDANSNAAPYTLANIIVLIDTAPVLASIGARYVDKENELGFTLSASDADGNSLTYYATNLPGGASFNTVLGAFSWIPADGQAGTYVVTFGVTDGYLSDSENVTITVNDVNYAPVIIAFEPVNGSVFNEVGDTRIFTITVDQTLNVTWLINGTEVFSQDGVTESTYTNTSAVSGTWNVSAIVENENGTDMHTLEWIVTEPNLIHVSDISMSTKTAGINTNSIATVKILDADNNPVGGATVSGHWTDLTSDTDVGITDASGIVILKSDRVKRASGTFTFIVDNVTHSVFTYNPSANVEDQGSIIVP